MRRSFMPKIWIAAVGVDSKKELIDSGKYHPCWTVSSKSLAGDLILFYCNSPQSHIRYIFKITGDCQKKLAKSEGGYWTKKKNDYFASIERITKISVPLTYKEIMHDKSLSSSQFVAMNMNGRFDATEYWGRLYEILTQKNPDLKEILSEYSSEKIYR
jgi:hypothetical protein